MKPIITLSYKTIIEAIRTNQGRAALMIDPDGNTVLTDSAKFKPANHVLIDLPLPTNNYTDVQAIDLINAMNAHGLSNHTDDVWRGQRIYGQSPSEMFTFEFDF